MDLRKTEFSKITITFTSFLLPKWNRNHLTPALSLLVAKGGGTRKSAMARGPTHNNMSQSAKNDTRVLFTDRAAPRRRSPKIPQPSSPLRLSLPSKPPIRAESLALISCFRPEGEVLHVQEEEPRRAA